MLSHKCRVKCSLSFNVWYVSVVLTGWQMSLSPSQTWTSQWSHTVETFSSRWNRKELNLNMERLSLAFSKIVTVLSEEQLSGDKNCFHFEFIQWSVTETFFKFSSIWCCAAFTPLECRTHWHDMKVWWESKAVCPSSSPKLLNFRLQKADDLLCWTCCDNIVDAMCVFNQLNMFHIVPVDDETPPLLVCRVRSRSGPAVVDYNFKSERCSKPWENDYGW